MRPSFLDESNDTRLPEGTLVNAHWYVVAVGVKPHGVVPVGDVGAQSPVCPG
jgi:hypothetical protein